MAAAVHQPPQQAPPRDTYTFASQPRPVKQRKQYRVQDNAAAADQAVADAALRFGNLMWDRRVVRGSTYAQNVLPATQQPDPLEIQRQQEVRRRALAKRRAKEQLKPRSPEPPEGRKHQDVQTELYLEELSDRVEEADVECQTDAFLDRPPSPLFIPAKTGVDVETQIMEGDLFDFDVEVKPILEVLVGKTIEQSLLEVMEEEELAQLRAQQRSFEELRNAELVEQQRLEEQERRHREEKERRMKQQREILRKERETAEKIAARAFAQSYLSDLVPSVFGTLSDSGYFYDPVERDVELGFMPWVLDRVGDKLTVNVLARTVLDSIVRDVVVARREAQHKLLLSESAAAMARAAEAAEEEGEAAAGAVGESAEDPSAADEDLTGDDVGADGGMDSDVPGEGDD